jgi:hypothetical protein
MSTTFLLAGEGHAHRFVVPEMKGDMKPHYMIGLTGFARAKTGWCERSKRVGDGRRGCSQLRSHVPPVEKSAAFSGTQLRFCG